MEQAVIENKLLGLHYNIVEALFIIFLAGRHLCFYGAAHVHQLVQCILQLSKCPPADAHVRGAMEMKMAAGCEYDEYYDQC
jgi:hypothetical protein